jgi:protein-disulfide isomerase
MSSSRPSGRPSSDGGVPPTSRRSARQQRIASREANRALTRASTRGGGGGGMQSLLIYSVAAVVIAAVVIGAALLLTGGKSTNAGSPDFTPNPPVGSAVTPKNVPMNGRTIGDPNAPHTIDVWEDFQCPNCRNFSLEIEPQLINNYVINGEVKLTYHDFIVIDSNTGGHESLDAANAARCAQDQGMFWEYHDWLFTNQYAEGSGAFSKDRLKLMGQLMGIPDLNAFDSCVDNGTHDSDVKAESASHPSDATGTPSIVVDGQLQLSYDYATVSATLNQILGVTPSPSVSASASASASAVSSESPAVSSSESASAAPTAPASAS